MIEAIIRNDFFQEEHCLTAPDLETLKNAVNSFVEAQEWHIGVTTIDFEFPDAHDEMKDNYDSLNYQKGLENEWIKSDSWDWKKQGVIHENSLGRY